MDAPITAAAAIAAHGMTFRERNRTSGGELKARYDAILAKHPKLDRGNHANHLGTLGTGNHFIEVCLDESDQRLVHAAQRFARSRQSHGELLHRARAQGHAEVLS